MTEVQPPSLHTLVFRSLKRTHDFFLSDSKNLPPKDQKLEEMKMKLKARDWYSSVKDVADKEMKKRQEMKKTQEMNENLDRSAAAKNSLAIVPVNPVQTTENTTLSNIVTNPIKKASPIVKPKWHAPWKLYRVISGHLGWVRCCAVEPGNKWFATGSADRVIKIWDLASGELQISLTGHISSVRGLAFSSRHPYLFSCGEDKQVKCWDLEYNKVIRHYHGHLSAVYSMALHPTIDILTTAGTDCTARVWDMRTKANIHTLTGHTKTVFSVISQVHDPQIITGSHDSTIRLWDLAAGRSMVTLTHHKKTVRTLIFHPTLNMFASGSPDNIKQWKSADGKFIQNLSGHKAVVNCLAVNEDGVLVSGADDGTMHLWDWRTGYNFQRMQVPVQPGSMDSEGGILSATFDMSGTRLITTVADKTIKLFKEDDSATEENYPINWKPEIVKRKKY